MADPSEYSEILTDDPQIYRQLSEGDHPLLKQKSIRFYDDPAISLRLLYSLERGMEEALDTRVWLKCGGYLVIEPTEAMTVIDVNSGKNEAKKAGEDTYYQVNLEAAEEVARQLRLRNLSGIIIVDFINMAEKERQKELLETLKNLTAGDPQHPRIVDMTPLGLVEITRKNLIPRWQNNSRDNKIKRFHPYRRTWNPHYCRQYQNTAGGYCSSQKCRNQRVSFQTAASKSIVPHHEKLFIDSVIHQSTVLLAGFLLYFTILGNSFWQKRFLNFFFKNATLFL